MITAHSAAEGLVSHGLLVAPPPGLAMAFLSLALLVAIASKRKAKSVGLSLFLWFFFVLFCDLLVIGAVPFLEGSASTAALFVSLLGNPVGMVRVALLIVLDNVTIFGAPGAALLRHCGGSSPSVVVLAASLVAWMVIPALVAKSLLDRQDICLRSGPGRPFALISS